MRDPVIYRILKAHHPRTGDAWRIYPNYDFAHGQSDAIEGVTHSICTLEFEDHRPLYDWFIERLPVPRRPRQYEFARLNLTHTVLSKRRLIQLVTEGRVAGWDDPRMPTISGYRRVSGRRHPRFFFAHWGFQIQCDRRTESLEACARELLNRRPSAAWPVRPLKVVIVNYPEGQLEDLEAVNNPENEARGKRLVPFGRELYIEREDFMEDAPRRFFRLSVGREVRLRWAYLITCREVVRDDAGEIVELRCAYDPETKGGVAPDGRKVKGTLHWVSAERALDAEVRLYDHLFTKENPGSDGDYLDDVNPKSLEVLTGCKLEPSLKGWPPAKTLQFERLGYFCPDPDGTEDAPVFNRVVGLRDTWAKVRAKG